MTNKEFCKRLRKAKKIARGIYATHRRPYCIIWACRAAELDNSLDYEFVDYDNDKSSIGWVENHTKSFADIARVFNESIRALGEKP